jgi:hypothetical protein
MAKTKQEHAHEGKFEYQRFADRREAYYTGLDKIKEMDYAWDDLIHHFPAFVGHMTLSRFLGLYELYKMTKGVAGHIAEAGVYKGASLLLFAKLIKIFESEALTQVHGFDWFEGTGEDPLGQKVEKGSYKESYERVDQLIRNQQLESLTFLHKLDLTQDLKAFFDEHKHFQFKLVFLDAGIYDVLCHSLPLFWERLTPGGLLVLDQYNHELAPGESMCVREFLPDVRVETLENIWMPSGFIRKPFRN